MAESSRVPVPVRFGPFEVLPDSAELRKNGIRLKLSGQAIQILITLLERQGEIVTREELQHELWPGANFGDFEHGLNAAVNRLREVLGDSATEPRYVETVPRQGYRFIAPLQGATEFVPRIHPVKTEPTTVHWRVGIIVSLVIIGLSVVVFLLQPAHAPSQLNIVQFTSIPGFELGPSFSPDGTQIVYAANSEPQGWDWHLYIKAIGDEKTVRLTQAPGMSCCPEWSPDGKTIAYDHRKGLIPGEMDTGIFLMTPLGGAKRQIRRVFDSSSCISWSPDSKLLAYDDKPPGERSGIFLVPITGSLALRLTTAPDGMFDTLPAYSHDGKQIAFVRNTDDGGNPSIYLVSQHGGAPKKIVSLHGIGRPAWTADDKRIIFDATGYFIGDHRLFSVPTTGGEAERLQFISSDAAGPAISPRGEKLAFTTAFLDSNIWRIPLKSGASPSKLVASTRMDMQANFSPSGSKIAFASNRDGVVAVWTSNADGTDPVRLSRESGATAEWSPDGKHIVFDSNEGGRWFIVVADSDGSVEKRLTDEGVDRRAPSWSADGKWVYFSSNRSGQWEIWKTSFPGNEAVQVTRNGGGYAQESRDGRFVYYQKLRTNNRYDFALLPEIWKMPGSGGPDKVVVSVNDPAHAADLTWFWRVTNEGIYFVDNSAKPHPLLKLYSFGTHKVRLLRQLEKQAWGAPGIAVAPDKESVLITQVDVAGSDIMLVENFH
jgi:Tol biopolymer transport system component/DNA-binding winged helix-turn-helix (wHTH) protein